MTRRLVALLLMLVPALAVHAQGPVLPPVSPKKNQPNSIEDLKLPAGSVLVLVERLKDALNPKAVLLSVDQYKELVEKLRLLEGRARDALVLPHSCKMTGKLEGDHLQLKAEFAFVTQERDSRVLLGLKGAFLTEEGKLDQGLAPIDFREEGYAVEVAEPGTHRLSLPLQIPVGTKRATAPGGGAERAVEITLPGAAVTTLSLDLPVGVKELRWNETLEKRRSDTRWELVLGKAKALALAWREPVGSPGSGPLTTVDTQVTVKLDEVQASIAVEMTLEDLRGRTREWNLLLPAGARAEVRSPGGIAAELLPVEGKNFTHVLRLPEPSAERLVVTVQSVQPRPKPGGKLTVGPFLVQGAYRQQATILVQTLPGALRNERLVFHRHGDVFRKDVAAKTPLDSLVAAFQYWIGPGSPKISAKERRGWLDIEWKALPGSTEVRLEHVVELRGTDQSRYLDTQTLIRTKTEGRTVEGLEIQLPAPPLEGLAGLGGLAGSFLAAGSPWGGWPLFGPGPEPKARPLDFQIRNDGLGVEASPPDANNRIRLTLPQGIKEDFQLVLQGRFEVPPGAHHIVLEPPRVVAAVVGGGRTTIRTTEKEEILMGPPGREEPGAERHRSERTWERQPERIAFAWQPYRPDMAVRSQLDVTLYGNQARIRQGLSWKRQEKEPQALPGDAKADPLKFLVPPAAANFRVIGGGTLLGNRPEPGSAWILPEANRDLLLEFDLPLPWGTEAPKGAASGDWSVPLIWPAASTRRQVHLRLWSEGGRLPRLGRCVGEWTERGIESVPGKDSLPALVAEGLGDSLELRLRWSVPPAPPLPALLADKVLMQVVLTEEGEQDVRARFLLDKVRDRELRMMIPGGERSLQGIRLGDKRVPWESLPGDSEMILFRLEPDAIAAGTVLEIRYKVGRAEIEKTGWGESRLLLPRFAGRAFVPKVRWQVASPPGTTCLPSGTGLQSFHRWGFQGWLFGPEPSLEGDDLENWLSGRGDSAGSFAADLVMGQAVPAPLDLLIVTKQAWLLGCSGLLLVLGLLLGGFPLPRALFWLLLLLAGAGLCLLGAFRPLWIPYLVMGCQPGALVLGLVLGIHWLLQENYRRQVIFLPGFTRLKTGSSLIRGSNAGGGRETSTIDAPPPVGSQGAGSATGAPSSRG